MPDTASLLAGFGLTSGELLGDAVIISATGTEHVVDRYHHYKYDLRIEVNSADRDSIVDHLDDYILGESNSKRIKATRNWYHCVLTLNSITKTNSGYIINLTGDATR